MKNKLLCFLGIHSPQYLMKPLQSPFKIMYFRIGICEHCNTRLYGNNKGNKLYIS